jgi:hypothetical protein
MVSVDPSTHNNCQIRKSLSPTDTVKDLDKKADKPIMDKNGNPKTTQQYSGTAIS